MLTFEECKWYHKVMWTWLSENPRCDKHHWPIFKEINESIPYDCFACYFVCNNTIIRSCEFCPIDWGVTSHYDAPCCNIDTLYDKWASKCETIRHGELQNEEEISSLALAIANMEWTNHF